VVRRSRLRPIQDALDLNCLPSAAFPGILYFVAHGDCTERKTFPEQREDRRQYVRERGNSFGPVCCLTRRHVRARSNRSGCGARDSERLATSRVRRLECRLGTLRDGSRFGFRHGLS
jgi:hypothetical protein